MSSQIEPARPFGSPVKRVRVETPFGAVVKATSQGKSFALDKSTGVTWRPLVTNWLHEPSDYTFAFQMHDHTGNAGPLHFPLASDRDHDVVVWLRDNGHLANEVTRNG